MTVPTCSPSAPGISGSRWLFGLPWSPQLNLLAQTTFALVLPSALDVFLWAALNEAFIRSQ